MFTYILFTAEYSNEEILKIGQISEDMDKSALLFSRLTLYILFFLKKNTTIHYNCN